MSNTKKVVLGPQLAYFFISKDYRSRTSEPLIHFINNVVVTGVV